MKVCLDFTEETQSMLQAMKLENLNIHVKELEKMPITGDFIEIDLAKEGAPLSFCVLKRIICLNSDPGYDVKYLLSLRLE